MTNTSSSLFGFLFECREFSQISRQPAGSESCAKFVHKGLFLLCLGDERRVFSSNPNSEQITIRLAHSVPEPVPWETGLAIKNGNALQQSSRYSCSIHNDQSCQVAACNKLENKLNLHKQNMLRPPTFLSTSSFLVHNRLFLPGLFVGKVYQDEGSY